MRVGLNQPIKREVIGKMMEFTESDGLTESVTDEGAEESPIMQGRHVRRARKGLRKYKSRVRKLKENREVKGHNGGNVAGRFKLGKETRKVAGKRRTKCHRYNWRD